MRGAGQDMDDSAASRERLVREYFEVADGRKAANMLDLFTDDAEVYFPKYGVGKGATSIAEIGQGLHAILRAIEHQTDDFRIHHAGSTVIVEGTTRGETADGRTWQGGVTVSGHFCSVFEISSGKIARMYIYLDPDYGGVDAGRYPWPGDGDHGSPPA